MNNRVILAITVALALGLSCEMMANDGNEFRQTRQANNPQGKLLSANDVVFNTSLNPKRTKKDYFKKENGTKYPFAYSSNQSLFLVKSEGDTVCIAKGGQGIVYGETVSRNEFGIDGGVFMSNDRKKVAFYRKDESNVALIPFLDRKTARGALKEVRYPMAGTRSEYIQLGVYDMETNSTIYLNTDGEFSKDQYLTNICWNPSDTEIFIQVLDRDQQNMRLNSYNAITGEKIATVLTEHSDTWIEPQYPLHWLKGNDNLAIYATDNRDGYWNLYLINLQNNKVKRLAKFDRDMEYVANDGKNVFFTAPDFHPVNNYLWKVSINSGKVVQLTKEPGWHSIIIDEDCTQYVDIYEALDKAPESRLRSIKDGSILKVLEESKDPTQEWAYTQIDMGTVTSANGHDLNYYRFIKPLGFDPNKKYPLILYVYGGPHSQMVTNTFLGGLRRWEMYAAQKGFAVFVIDGRGTQRHSAAYEHAIYKHCGQCEMEDQMQAVAMLKEIPWIDKDRLGVYGWSYGGFMSLSLATGNPDVFKVAVAGGPVIDWKWYEVMYGERYMSTPERNPEGFESTSLLNKAKDLKAKTLVIQGGMDVTVLPLNALSFIQKCVDNSVKVDFFTYPDAEHNMRGKDRVHLVDKITDWFIDNL